MKKKLFSLFIALTMAFTCLIPVTESAAASGTYTGTFPSLPNGISTKAIEYAWAYGTDKDVYSYPDGKANDAFNKAITAAYGARTNWQKASKAGASCDVFVGTVLRNSYDTKYSPYLEKQIPYLASSSKYTKIADKSNYNKSKLKPGDIIVFSRQSSSHTCICVDINGVIYTAEASYQKSFGHINKLQNYKMSNYKRFEVYRAKNSCVGYLAKGQYSTNVKYLQSFLNWAGFNCGTPDGAFGSNTETAVKKFQKAAGLTADGKFGSSSLKAAKSYKKKSSTTKPSTTTTVKKVYYTGKLPTTTISSKKGSKTNIKRWQQFLKWYGYSMTTGGTFGKATISNTKKFQKANNLTADGIVGTKTIAKAKKVTKLSSSSTSSSAVKKKYTGTFPTLPSRGYFKKGDKGTQVKRLQIFLNWAGCSVSRGGTYGSKTISAVKKFQKKYGLKQDGLFGKKALAKAKTIKK